MKTGEHLCVRPRYFARLIASLFQLTQLAEALHYLHTELCVVHGEVKCVRG